MESRKDHFKRELLSGDLVVYKGSGESCSMTSGVVLEDGRIWNGGSFGGRCQLVRIDTTNDGGLDKIRIDLLQSRVDEIARQEKDKAKKKTSRIRKRDFQRFTSYSSDGGNNYGVEVFLGDCEIDGRFHDSVWVTLCKKEYSLPFGRNNLKTNLTTLQYGSPVLGTRRPTWRSVIFPLKTCVGYTFTREDIESMIAENLKGTRVAFKIL